MICYNYIYELLLYFIKLQISKNVTFLVSYKNQIFIRFLQAEGMNQNMKFIIRSVNIYDQFVLSQKDVFFVMQQIHRWLNGTLNVALHTFFFSLELSDYKHIHLTMNLTLIYASYLQKSHNARIFNLE